jgi:two-component system sensor histidine kinase KdpD
MAAGVGKTYRMLQHGHAEADAGRDVLIGYLEPHGRQETAARAEGLELLPRRRVTYRTAQLDEMDLPAILRRHPQLCLIDELAHTNAPGLEHERRYEDVEDLLAAGIDVYSTINVQHLESLNDELAALTGSRVRETVPDSVLSSAEAIVLVDVTPQTLIERLRAGKVYPSERVQAALNNFFKLENLSALREAALKQVAQDIEGERLPSAQPMRAPAHAIGERVLALIKPRPSSQRVIRGAWRTAQQLGAELDLLWVTDHDPTEEEQRQLQVLRHLASVLGAHLLIEQGHDVAATAKRVASERGATHLLIGTPKQLGAIRRLAHTPLPYQLLAALPGVDLRIVADRAETKPTAPMNQSPP